MKGTVVFYNPTKQFGFIRCIGSEFHGKKVICNKKDLINTEYLVIGDFVDFIISQDGRARDIFLVRKDGLRMGG